MSFTTTLELDDLRDLDRYRIKIIRPPAPEGCIWFNGVAYEVVKRLTIRTFCGEIKLDDRTITPLMRCAYDSLRDDQPRVQYLGDDSEQEMVSYLPLYLHSAAEDFAYTTINADLEPPPDIRWEVELEIDPNPDGFLQLRVEGPPEPATGVFDQISDYIFGPPLTYHYAPVPADERPPIEWELIEE